MAVPLPCVGLSMCSIRYMESGREFWVKGSGSLEGNTAEVLIHMYACMDTQTYIHTCIHTYVYIYVHTYIHHSTYIQINYLDSHRQRDIYMQTYLYRNIQTCMQPSIHPPIYHQSTHPPMQASSIKGTGQGSQYVKDLSTIPVCFTGKLTRFYVVQ